MKFNKSALYNNELTTFNVLVEELLDEGKKYRKGTRGKVNLGQRVHKDKKKEQKKYKTRKKYNKFEEEEKKSKKKKNPCWKGYKMVGFKKKGKREVPNCVPVKNKKKK